jgi:GH24 family phage-related lysozyme (muramidase)
MIKAIVALVEAMGGQAGGQIVRQLTAKDYKDMAIEMELWKGGNGAHRTNRRQRKNLHAVAN